LYDRADMSRVVLFIATSVDGFIARRNGDVAWLFPFSRDYGQRAFFRSVGTAVMGRKTWRDVLKFDGGPYPRMANVVVTHKPLRRRDVTAWSGPLARLVRDLRASHPRKEIWLVGGASLNAQFLDAGLIDRFIVTIVPVVLGDGIPLFVGARRSPRVKLVSTRSWRDGVVQLTWESVRRAGSRRGR
jgi:dihydrofolate reductase